MALDLVDLKVVALFAILLEAFVFGLLPLLSKRVPPRLAELVIGVSNAFAGGVFLSVGFVHLLGESAEMFATAAPQAGEFPLAMFTAGGTFLFTFFIEKLFFSGHGHSHSHSPPPPSMRTSREGHTRLTASDKESAEAPPPADEQPNAFAPYTLLVVLCVHSFMTGVALGIAGDVSNGTLIFVSVAVHKWVEAFAVGTSLLGLRDLQIHRRKYILIIAIFALVGEPFGISVGIGLSSADFGSFDVVQAILNAIAAGMFIYVAAFDILAETFNHDRHKYWKALACMTAFLLMCMLNFVLPHDHTGGTTDDGHDHDH